MATIFDRLKVLVPGVAAGACCLAAYAAEGLPSAWPLSVRVEAWGLMMSGPLLPVFERGSCSPGAAFVVLAVALFWSPLALAHPLRPGLWTGALTLLALLCWFLAGWVTMVQGTWGA